MNASIARKEGAMPVRWLARGVLLALFATVLAACSKGEDSMSNVVVEEDVIADNGDVVVSEFAYVPEDEVDAIREARPSDKHVWVPGYWKRKGATWKWEKGRWEIPPDKHAFWRAGHWRWMNDSWHWVKGYWAVSRSSLATDTAIPIPELLDEEVPAKPSNKNHWVAGYWEWDGTWYWIPGYWTNKPYPEAEWVAGHWDTYGSYGWRWVAGHWEIKNS